MQAPWDTLAHPLELLGLKRTSLLVVDIQLFGESQTWEAEARSSKVSLRDIVRTYIHKANRQTENTRKTSLSKSLDWLKELASKPDK